MHNCPDRPCSLLTASCMDETACLQEDQPESFKGLLTGNYEPKKCPQVLAYSVSNPSPSKEVEWTIADEKRRFLLSWERRKSFVKNDTLSTDRRTWSTAPWRDDRQNLNNKSCGLVIRGLNQQDSLTKEVFKGGREEFSGNRKICWWKDSQDKKWAKSNYSV